MRNMIACVLMVMIAVSPALADYYDGLRAFDQKDYGKAFQEWKAAADAGDARSQFRVGRLYEDGLGVPQSLVQAHFYYNLAAAQGGAEARSAREAIAVRMAQTELAEARRLATDWKPAVSSLKTPSVTLAPAPSASTPSLPKANGVERDNRADETRVPLPGPVQNTVEECVKEPTPGCLLSHALGVAREESNSRSRANQLRYVGEAWGRAGGGENARKLLRDALESTEQANRREGNAGVVLSSLQSLADSQWRAGFKDDAAATYSSVLDLTLGISKPEDRLRALRSLGGTQIELGNYAGATSVLKHAARIAGSLPEGEMSSAPYLRYKALAEVAVLQLLAGDAQGSSETFSAAIDIARNLPIPKPFGGMPAVAHEDLARKVGSPFMERFKGLIEIARNQVSVVDYPSAVRTARLAETFIPALKETVGGSSIAKDAASARVASALAQAGDLEGAAAIIDNLKTPYTRADAFAEVALAQARAGKRREASITFSRAYGAMHSIDVEITKEMTFNEIAKKQIQSGMLRDALEKLSSKGSDPAMDPLRALMALFLARHGDFARAKQVIDSMGTAKGSLETLAEAGVQFAEVGDFETAQAIREKLDALLPAASGSDFRSKIARYELDSQLRRLDDATAAVMARNGKLDEAFAILDKQSESSNRSLLIWTMAKGLAVNPPQKVLEAARKLGSSEERSVLIASVSYAMARRGDLSSAVTLWNDSPENVAKQFYLLLSEYYADDAAGKRTRQAQELLEKLGYGAHSDEGFRLAVRRYQAGAGLPLTGKVSPQLLAHLKATLEAEAKLLREESERGQRVSPAVQKARDRVQTALQKAEDEKWAEVKENDLLMGYLQYLKSGPPERYIPAAEAAVARLKQEEAEMLARARRGVGFLNGNHGVYTSLGCNNFDEILAAATRVVIWSEGDVMYWDIFRRNRPYRSPLSERVGTRSGTIGNQQVSLDTYVFVDAKDGKRFSIDIGGGWLMLGGGKQPYRQCEKF